MRLLVFTTQFPPAIGGVEMMTWQLSEHLRRKGVEVTVLAPELPDAAEFDGDQAFRIERFPFFESKTIGVKAKQKLNLIRTLRDARQKTQADCILCTGWDPCAYVASIAAGPFPGIPYFLIAHGMELMQIPRKFPFRYGKVWLRRRALRDARRIFAVSNFTRDRVIELGASADRVCVIPNGVELDSDVPSELREYGGQRILVTVSRLVPRKGHDLVLRALPRVIERFPKVKYRIVGDGPERVRLEGLAQQLRIGNCVEFLGRVTETEKHQILKACEVFIMPCRETETDFEGFGISLLEAMSYGKPVIAGRSGGIPDVITDGETGLLIDPTDVDELADRIIFTLENHTDADRLGLTALQRVQEQFTWESVSHRYLSAMTSGEA